VEALMRWHLSQLKCQKVFHGGAQSGRDPHHGFKRDIHPAPFNGADPSLCYAGVLAEAI